MFEISFLVYLWLLMGAAGWLVSIKYFGETGLRWSLSYIVACVIFGPVSLAMALGGIAYDKRKLK